MPLRVAFDLDGTLADMDRVLRREAAQLFGPMDAAVVDTDAARAGGAADAPDLDLTAKQWARLWSHVRRTEDFWLSLPEMEEGIVARVADLAATRRWDVLFLTTRPSVHGQTTQVQSQRWLEVHGFPLPSVYVVQRSRGLIAQALQLDVVVDDRLANCVDVALESSAVPILIKASAVSRPSDARPAGVRVVASIREAVDLVDALDADHRRHGVVRSIRKWLGR